MNIFAISGLINSVSVFALGGIVYFKNRKKEINIRYALFCFFCGIWSICYFFWQVSQDRNSALFWSRSLMAGAIFIPICFLHFVLLLLGLYEKRKKIVIAGYGIFLLFFIFNFTPWFISDVKPKMFFKFWPEPGPIFAIFLLIWFWYCLYPCYLLIRDYSKFTGLKRLQIKYVLIGVLIGYGSGSTNYFLWYDIPVPPYGNFIVPFFVGLMAYAVIRLRLMDINIVFTRIGIFALVYAFVLGIPFCLAGWGRVWLMEMFDKDWFWLPMFILLGLASAGPFIYSRLRQQAENRLLAEERRGRDLLAQAAEGMVRIRELKKLLSLIVHITVQMLKLTGAAVYLLDKDTKQYKLQAVRSKSTYINAPNSLNPENILIQKMSESNEPLVYEEVKLESQDLTTDTNNHIHSISAQMHSLSASLIVPSLSGKTMLGFIVLGAKKSGRIYTEEDVKLLKTLANQAALAIENAQFYEEEAERKALLYQSAVLSDLGVMADSMGHQIKNHLQKMMAIAGSEAGILEEFLNQDLTLDKAKELINRVIKALAKLEDQGKAGASSIETIRKFSHLSRGEFSYLNLQEVIGMAKDVLQFKLKFDEFDYTEDIPKDLPAIYAHPILTEAFVNFIDNAYDATKETEEILYLEAKKTALPPPPYRGKIVFQARLKDENTLEIKVTDNGIGIKEENLKNLFFPFYTTKATSTKKGTGLGLYVIKNIINSHNGSITVDSGYMKGTTFTITLPMQSERRAK